MKIQAFIDELTHLSLQHGPDMEVVLQDDGERNTHPPCCKHEHFFIVEEGVKDDDGKISTECVLRTWPY